MPKLYLDLSKAVGQSASVSAKKGDQTKVDYDESFTETPSGVGGEGPPAEGSSKGQGKPLDEDLEEKRQARNMVSQARNLTPTKEELGIKKSLDVSAADMVKSLTSNLRDVLDLRRYTPTEREFLHIVKGYSLEDINRGTIAIEGSDRADFSAWLCLKAQAALDKMYRR